MNMNWNWLTYENGMSHAVTNDLLAAVMDNMATMDPPGVLRIAKSINDVYLDQGGMTYIDRPIEEIEFDDLRISVPSEDLGDLAERWKVSVAWMSSDRTFYRFTGWPDRCIVMDPDQGARFLDLARSRVEVAERRAFDFFASRETPQEMLRARNRDVLGGDAASRIPYGPDKNDRFRSS
jgi:hypothetical protein